MALKRGRDARAEVKALRLEITTKDAQLDALAVQLAQREVAAVQRQAEADARLNELCARLEAGDVRARQMQQELQALVEQAEVRVKEVHVGCRVAPREDHKPPPADVARLAQLEADARRAVSVTMDAGLPAETQQQLVEAKMARALGGESVRRSGKDSELRPLLEEQVAKEVQARVQGGAEEPTEAEEVARLKALGFGRKQRTGGVPRQPRGGDAPRKRARRVDEAKAHGRRCRVGRQRRREQ